MKNNQIISVDKEFTKVLEIFEKELENLYNSSFTNSNISKINDFNLDKNEKEFQEKLSKIEIDIRKLSDVLQDSNQKKGNKEKPSENMKLILDNFSKAKNIVSFIKD